MKTGVSSQPTPNCDYCLHCNKIRNNFQSWKWNHRLLGRESHKRCRFWADSGFNRVTPPEGDHVPQTLQMSSWEHIRRGGKMRKHISVCLCLALWPSWPCDPATFPISLQKKSYVRTQSCHTPRLRKEKPDVKPGLCHDFQANESVCRELLTVCLSKSLVKMLFS